MLNMYSTIAIEASTFQLPSTKLCLRDKCKAMFGNFRQDFMAHYVQSYNERLVQTGGVKTVFTMAELCGSINRYIDNPKLDKKGRKLIMENEAGPFRGGVKGINNTDIVGKVLFAFLIYY